MDAGGGVGGRGRGEFRGKGRRGHRAFVLLLDQPWEGEKGGPGSRRGIDCVCNSGNRVAGLGVTWCWLCP